MKIKRITANLPQDLLEEAMSVTHENLTDTLVFALKLVRRTRVYAKAKAAKGSLKFEIDLDVSRERRR